MWDWMPMNPPPPPETELRGAALGFDIPNSQLVQDSWEQIELSSLLQEITAKTQSYARVCPCL